MSSDLINDWFQKKLGYGLIANDQYGVLKRTAALITASRITPERLRHRLNVSRTSAEKLDHIKQAFLDRPIDPLTPWTFFRGMFEGEHRFLSGALTTWDSEPVLTGDLLTEVFRTVQAWGSKVQTITGKDPMVHLCRTNTVMNRGEGLSGGDFGLIIQFRQDLFISLVIQVKLVHNLSAEVHHYVAATDELQRDTLNRVPNLGHYLFIRKKFADQSALPPLMRSAHDVVCHMSLAGGNSFPAVRSGIDMAAYLAFGPGTAMGIGVRTDSPEDAAQVIFAGYPSLANALDRIFVLRLGSELDYNWDDIVAFEAARSNESTTEIDSNAAFSFG